MCTLTWLTRQDGYDVFFNRDELRTRKLAQQPSAHIVNDVQVIHPVDSDAGGTWISVNEHGVTLTLLNKYEAESPKGMVTWKSRGLLVQALSCLTDLNSVIETLRTTELAIFKAFNLVIFEPNQIPVQMTWDGFQLTQLNNPKIPLTSSSYKTQNVITARIEYFNGLIEKQGLTEETLMQFHGAHSPSRGPFSVCMHRPDASTVSFSAIKVNKNDVCFSYSDVPLCKNDHLSTIKLAHNEAFDCNVIG